MAAKRQSDDPRLLLKQTQGIIDAVVAADRSLSIVGVDRRQLWKDICAAQDNVRIAQQLSDKKRTRENNERLKRMKQAADKLGAQLKSVCFERDGAELSEQNDWLRRRLNQFLSVPIDDLKNRVDDLSYAAGRPVIRLQMSGSVNQMFVSEGLRRVFAVHFRQTGTRKRIPIDNDSDGRLTVHGAFIAFAVAVSTALKSPLTAETVSSMMTNRQRRNPVGQ